MFGFTKLAKENNTLKERLDFIAGKLERKESDYDRLLERHRALEDSLREEYDRESTRKDFEIERVKHDMEIKNEKDKSALTKQISEKDKEIAVLTAKLEITNSVVDLNSDVLDVKNVVEQLISKLPNIDINSITTNASTKE